jgi:xanthine dehydrogenase small subunit
LRPNRNRDFRVPRDHIRFIFRGEPLHLSGFPATRSLLDWLREDRRAVGTKEGCNEGDCGACTVVLARVEDGRLVHRPVNACITFLGMADGAEVMTIEDLAEGGRLHPIQQAMVEHHGSQCGFCTPGIVMSLFAMGKEGGPVDRAQINDQLAGNLCRCTGYRPIIDAALASVGASDHFDAVEAERIAALESLDNGEGALVPSLRGGGADEAIQTTSLQAAPSSGLLRYARNDGFFAIPRTLDEALALCAAHPDATILAGATDVGLWITKQFRPVTKLIWLGRVAELQRIDEDEGELRIGAGVTHEAALRPLAGIAPDLGELGRRFGSRQVRAQGTVGGNIANGSPIGDWAPAFIALGGAVQLASAEGRRALPLEAFFIAYGKQDRRPGEIVAGLVIPKLRPGERFRCIKLSKRFDEDISAVMGAFKLTLDGDRIAAARIAFGGMAATPKRAPAAEAALVGASLGDRASWSEAIGALAEDYQPIDDMRASARYRLEAAQALLTKALIEIGGGTATRIRPPQPMEASHAA